MSVETDWKDELKQCPICAKKNGTGLSYLRTDGGHQIVCICGLISVKFESIRDLMFWFNTRNGKQPKQTEKEVIHVKHATRELSGNPF